MEVSTDECAVSLFMNGFTQRAETLIIFLLIEEENKPVESLHCSYFYFGWGPKSLGSSCCVALVFVLVPL